MSQQQNRQIEPGVFESRFHVPQDLVGLAIGRNGNNLIEARRMDGVISIEYDDYSQLFIVKGQVSDVCLCVCVCTCCAPCVCECVRERECVCVCVHRV